MKRFNKLSFVSFGSDKSYLKLARKTLGELEEFYPEASFMAFGVDDLDCGQHISGSSPAAIKNYATAHPRGYGYWRWKPCVLATALRNQEEGGVTVYVDGRSSVPKARIDWLDQFTSDLQIDIVAWQMNFVERNYTTTDLLQRFGYEAESINALTGQYAATFFGMRNNERCRSFVNEWGSFLVTNVNLCRDDQTTLPNHLDFLENRHDQSVFSLLLKRAQGNLGVFTLGETDVMSRSSIKPHGKPHPIGVRVVGRIKILRFVKPFPGRQS